MIGKAGESPRSKQCLLVRNDKKMWSFGVMRNATVDVCPTCASHSQTSVTWNYHYCGDIFKLTRGNLKTVSRRLATEVKHILTRKKIVKCNWTSTFEIIWDLLWSQFQMQLCRTRQLALAQHGCELHRATYTRICCNSCCKCVSSSCAFLNNILFSLAYFCEECSI